MTPTVPLDRGSEWRKWDLHVHSPLSALNNQFPRGADGAPDWEQYLQRLEQLTDIAVLGITDYFSIEGYRKVREFQDGGRLKNISLILPNIELRLGTFTGENRRVNYHVIFSDAVSPDDIDNHFLGELRFTYESSPDDASSQWPVSRPNLTALGERLKKDHGFSGGTYQVGCTHATVTAEHIKAILKNKGSLFAGKYLLVVENASSISWDSQDHQTRKTLLQGAHALFSGNARDASWARGERDIPPEEFVREFKSLKPCLHGSDAHQLDKICVPTDQKYCWIKADTTFEGLRQILYEPSDRLYIGDRPPDLKNDYQIIDSVQVDSPAWFLPDRIPINRDLVAIIGGRGSGKSALAEVISFAGGSRVFATEDTSDSFLAKASTRSTTNPTPIIGGRVTLKWRDGTKRTAPITPDLGHDLGDERVKYLPQKFVERLCAPENNEQLEQEIERVIFQRIDKTDRLDASDFGELRESATQALRMKKAQVNKAIRSLNETISQTARKIELRPSKTREFTLRKAEMEALTKRAPEMPAEDSEELKRRDELVKIRQDLENGILRHNEQLKSLGTIETKWELFSSDVRSFNAEIDELLKMVGLEDERSRFLISLPTGSGDVLLRRRAELANAIKILKEGDPQDATVASLKAADAGIKELDRISQLTETRKAQLDKYQKDRQQLENTIASLEREIKEIEDVAIPELERELELRERKYCEYFDLLKEERELLETLYEPLRRALLTSNDTARKLTFVSRVTLNVQHHASVGYELVDRRAKYFGKTSHWKQRSGNSCVA